MKQTAVEWLIKELNLEGYDFTIERAKEMEKEQIINSWNDGSSFYAKGCKNRNHS